MFNNSSVTSYHSQRADVAVAVTVHALNGDLEPGQKLIEVAIKKFLLSISGDIVMGDKGGSKDKGKREKQKKAKRTPKEKRKARNDKKNSGSSQ